jgi:hypothetical protein
MVYTCYEMIRDCREDKAEGWAYFVANYAPVISRLAAHYGLDFDASLTMLRDPAAGLFQSMAPAPERWFVAELRQRIVAGAPGSTPGIRLDLETVADAFSPLTLVEKQAAWFETMRFSSGQTAEALRMAPSTVEKIRERAGELLRGKVDSWRRGLLPENGRALGMEVAEKKTEECLPSKTFLDVLDGRSTWRGREEMERHVASCWHCIDHFCRMAEVVELLRGLKPLDETEAAPLRRKLGVETAKRGLWRR